MSHTTVVCKTSYSGKQESCHRLDLVEEEKNETRKKSEIGENKSCHTGLIFVTGRRAEAFSVSKLTNSVVVFACFGSVVVPLSLFQETI